MDIGRPGRVEARAGLIEHVAGGPDLDLAENDDARGSVEDDLPDVKEKVLVLAYTSDIPNDSVSFIKDFPADLRDQIVTALLEIAETEEGQTALENLYSIAGLQEADDSFYDAFRADLSKAGINIEELAE